MWRGPIADGEKTGDESRPCVLPGMNGPTMYLCALCVLFFGMKGSALMRLSNGEDLPLLYF